MALFRLNEVLSFSNESLASAAFPVLLQCHFRDRNLKKTYTCTKKENFLLATVS